MDIVLDKISNTEALIKVNLKEGDYQSKVEEKIREYSKKAQIKGFRQGNVPQGMIQKMYGKSILVDEINHMVSHKVMDFIKENELQILGDPLPNQEKVESLDWDNAKEFDFEYNIGMASDFEVKLDNKVKVETYSIKVDDALINETIENLRNQFGQVTSPDISEEGDSLYGEILVEEGENRGILLDPTQLEKKDRKNCFGKKSGDVIEFDPFKSLKDEAYRTQFLGDDLKEQKGKIQFQIKNVNRTIPAAINQDLFDQTFGKDLVKSEDEFRSKIKDSISENYARETDGYTDLKVRDKLIEKTKIDLPDGFLKKWLTVTNDQLTQEQIEQDFPHYVNDLKWSLIKNKVAKTNNLELKHEDVVEEAKNLIRAQFGSMGMSEQMEQNMDAFADNYLKGNEGENYRKLYEKAFSDKVLDFIRSNVTIKVKTVTADEYRKKA